MKNILRTECGKELVWENLANCSELKMRVRTVGGKCDSSTEGKTPGINSTLVRMKH